MTSQEAYKVVEAWETAVGNLWNLVVRKANEATVQVPSYKLKIERLTIALSDRGIEVILGSQGARFTSLISTAEFDISKFPALQKFVSESIKQGNEDVLKLVEARKKAMDVAFKDLNREVAEWNLLCEKGQEIKP